MVEVVLVSPLLVAAVLQTYLYLANKPALTETEVYQEVSISCIKSAFNPQNLYLLMRDDVMDDLCHFLNRSRTLGSKNIAHGERHQQSVDFKELLS